MPLFGSFSLTDCGRAWMNALRAAEFYEPFANWLRSLLFVLFRVISWIILLMRPTNDPRNHTNQHEETKVPHNSEAIMMKPISGSGYIRWSYRMGLRISRSRGELGFIFCTSPWTRVCGSSARHGIGTTTLISHLRGEAADSVFVQKVTKGSNR